MAYKIPKPKRKVKMAVYKDGEMVDFGVYDSMAEAKADFKNWDKPRGRTAEFEYE